MKKIFVSATVLTLIAVFVFAGCSKGIQTVRGYEQPKATQQAEPLNAAPAEDEGQLSYVSIDINPSIRLTIKDGIVLNAEAFNDDGAQIVLESDVTGLLPDEAVNMIVSAIANQGYIDDADASLVITACGDRDDEVLDSLKDTAHQALADLGFECDVVASKVSNQVVEDAKAAGLTPGRYKILSFLAQQENISLDEAKEKYGALKMGALIAMVDDVGAVFGKRDVDDDRDEVEEGLTPEQQQMLNQAESEFKAAMRAAQREFLQTKTQVQNQVKVQRADIQNAYRSSKNLSAYKEAKTALKEQYDAQKRAARQVFLAAKTQAKERFREAVGNIGLSDSQINAVIGRNDEPEWDDQLEFEPERGEDDEDKDEKDQKNGAGPGVNNGKGRGKPID